jgi:hypothetical protein
LHVKDIGYLKKFYQELAEKYKDIDDPDEFDLAEPFSKYSSHVRISYYECLNIMERETV